MAPPLNKSGRSDFEYDELKDRAREANLPLAVYIRRQAFYNDTVRRYEIIQDPEGLKNLEGEFGKIGANLNQIARYFNTVGDPVTCHGR